MTALRDDRAKFAAAETTVFGVNPGTAESHRGFVEEHGLGFHLIVDDDRAVARAFDALKEDGQAIERTVAIIDQDGTVRYLERGLPTNEDLLRVIAGFTSA